MSETTALVKKMEVRYETQTGEVRLNPNIIKRYLVHGKVEFVTETELVMFMQLCRFQQLNPYLREAYLIKFSERDPAAVVVGKDTFTKRAAGVPLCQGYNAGIIIRNKDGKIERRIGANLLENESLIGGWAKVFRKGWTEALETEVSLKEYMRFAKSGEPTRSWTGMPSTMIRKCALVAALREAFPDHFAHQYTAEEMPIDDSELPTAAVQVTPEEDRELERIAGEGFEQAAPQSSAVEQVPEQMPAPVQPTPAAASPREASAAAPVARTGNGTPHNPFKQRAPQAREAEAKANGGKPRTFAQRMQQEGPVPASKGPELDIY